MIKDEHTPESLLPVLQSIVVRKTPRNDWPVLRTPRIRDAVSDEIIGVGRTRDYQGATGCGDVPQTQCVVRNIAHDDGFQFDGEKKPHLHHETVVFVPNFQVPRSIAVEQDFQWNVPV